MWTLLPHLQPLARTPAAQRLWNTACKYLPLDPVVIEEEDDRELEKFMGRPQRHRLLHGYPLAQAMPRRKDAAEPAEAWYGLEPRRGLLMGVLPHPFCNPAVAGCGFCTFPHQRYHAGAAASIVEHVGDEVEQRVRLQPALRGRSVDALYFGGGTANLTPPEDFERLCRRLAAAFAFARAEVTLEGVPAYFVKRRPLLMDLLQQTLPARFYRVSMGIQTFDRGQLERMGRLAFGTADTFAEVVRAAHARGFTASADLLFNLPGQTLPQMRDDIARAVDLGLDHLGLYHLVLFRGLGTAWSRDPGMVAGLPSNARAAEHWLALREFLLENGFYQTTLTNFERRSFQGQPGRFRYEEMSFQPDRHDMIGFGPSGISFAAGATFGGARKILNPESADAYTDAVKRGVGPWDRGFDYGSRDLRVFYLTRRLAALGIDRGAYRGLFGADPLADFGKEFRALARAGLVEVTPHSIRPTPRGMFYADSIAGLLAWRRTRALRQNLPGGNGAAKGVPEPTVEPAVERGPGNDNGYGHM